MRRPRFRGPFRRLGGLMILAALVAAAVAVVRYHDLSRQYDVKATLHRQRREAAEFRYHRLQDFAGYLRSESEDALRAAEADEPGLSPSQWRKRAELMAGAAEEMERLGRERVAHHARAIRAYSRAAARPWEVPPRLPPEP